MSACSWLYAPCFKAPRVQPCGKSDVIGIRVGAFAVSGRGRWPILHTLTWEGRQPQLGWSCCSQEGGCGPAARGGLAVDQRLAGDTHPPLLPTPACIPCFCFLWAHQATTYSAAENVFDVMRCAGGDAGRQQRRRGVAVSGAEPLRRGGGSAGQPGGRARLERARRPQLQLAPAAMGPAPPQEAARAFLSCAHVMDHRCIFEKCVKGQCRGPWLVCEKWLEGQFHGPQMFCEECVEGRLRGPQVFCEESLKGRCW